MPISNSNNPNSGKLPGVTIVTPVQIPELTAENIIQCVYTGDAAMAFNEAVQTYKSDVYCFMPPESIMLSPVELIADVLNTYEKFQFINCIYTDNIFKTQIQYLSSINPATLINNGIVVETPLFVRNPQPFKEDIRLLCCYEMLLRLAATTVTYHLPKIAFKVNRISLRPPKAQIDQELHIIYEQSH